MIKTYNYGNEMVTLSKCGKYGQFSNGRWADIRVENNMKYVVKEHFKQGCTKRNPEKFWLVGKENGSNK